jgi:hypothetical protein
MLFGSAPVLAAVPYAGADADRQAKQALPPAGKALVYVYRTADNGPALSPPMHLNTRAVGGLAAETYLYWAVAPGRLDLRAGDGQTLSLRIQEGRIYFVRLTVFADGRGELRQVSYGTGRQELRRARLVRETAPAKPAAVPAVARSGFSLILKGGSFSLGSASQDIDATDSVTGMTQTFRTSFTRSAPIYGLEGEWLGDNGWAFGGEVLVHNHDYTTVPTGALGRGEMQVVTVVFTSKKYFRPGSVVQPFVGAGLGLASVSLSGQLEGNTAGFAAQAVGGLAFRWTHVGLYTEVRYQLAATADVYASGAALLAGVGVQF